MLIYLLFSTSTTARCLSQRLRHTSDSAQRPSLVSFQKTRIPTALSQWRAKSWLAMAVALTVASCLALLTGPHHRYANFNDHSPAQCICSCTVRLKLNRSNTYGLAAVVVKALEILKWFHSIGKCLPQNHIMLAGYQCSICANYEYCKWFFFNHNCWT